MRAVLVYSGSKRSTKPRSGMMICGASGSVSSPPQQMLRFRTFRRASPTIHQLYRKLEAIIRKLPYREMSYGMVYLLIGTAKE